MSDRRNDLRSVRWREVWTGRDGRVADWNGYDACFPTLAAYEEWIAEVVGLIKRGLSLGADDVVADLGCGTGRIASRVRRLVRSVIAYDYSPTVLDLAREKRPATNVTYHLADLTRLDPAASGATKAYAVGSLFYLDSAEQAYSLIERCQAAGMAFAAIDLPDAAMSDRRTRSYDRSVFDHLRFCESELRRRFPGCRIERGAFPGYVNGPSRFNFYLDAPAR